MSKEKHGHENNKDIDLETINEKLEDINASLLSFVVVSVTLSAIILVLLIYLIQHITP